MSKLTLNPMSKDCNNGNPILLTYSSAALDISSRGGTFEFDTNSREANLANLDLSLSHYTKYIIRVKNIVLYGAYLQQVNFDSRLACHTLLFHFDSVDMFERTPRPSKWYIRGSAELSSIIDHRGFGADASFGYWPDKVAFPDNGWGFDRIDNLKKQKYREIDLMEYCYGDNENDTDVGNITITKTYNRL